MTGPEIIKKTGKTALLVVSPETARLSDDMGRLARYITCETGGLGEVVAALCEGVTARGIDCHLQLMLSST